MASSTGWLVTWVAAVSVSGCALTISGPDPARRRGEAPTCDTGKSLVGVDGVFGATSTLVALSLLGNDSAGGAAIAGAIGVAFIASAVRGNRLVNECRTELEEFAGLPQVPDDDDPPARTRPLVGRSAAPGADRARAAPDPAPVTPPAVPSVSPAAPATPPPPAPATTRPPAPPPHARAEADAWPDFWTEVP